MGCLFLVSEAKRAKVARAAGYLPSIICWRPSSNSRLISKAGVELADAVTFAGAPWWLKKIQPNNIRAMSVAPAMSKAALALHGFHSPRRRRSDFLRARMSASCEAKRERGSGAIILAMALAVGRETSGATSFSFNGLFFNARRSDADVVSRSNGGRPATA